MIDILKELSLLDGVSGCEDAVRNFIISQISPYSKCSVDHLGNIIAYKKGDKTLSKKVMIAAHMDEVGFVIHSITGDGYLNFSPIGGIDPRVVLGRTVRVGEKGICGVIGSKPVHMLETAERGFSPDFNKMYIDIGAKDKDQASEYICPGDVACFDSEFVEFGEGRIKGKALDDRAGCAIMIELIKKPQPYDLYFAFTVQEEIGTRGAKVATYSIEPDISIVLEATTAADINAVPVEQQVCMLGKGPAVSFMDGRTVYDRSLYKFAFDTATELGIPCQCKAGVSGGNDAGAIHLSRGGVRTLALSLPCRYLHSASCVIHERDFSDTLKLTQGVINGIVKEVV